MAGIPNITGSITDVVPQPDAGMLKGEGCFYSENYPGSGVFLLQKTTGNYDKTNTYFDSFQINASRSSSIYGSSTTVTPLSLSYLPVVKY